MKPLLIAIPSIALVLGFIGLVSYGRRALKKPVITDQARTVEVRCTDPDVLGKVTSERDSWMAKAVVATNERDEARAKLRRRSVPIEFMVEPKQRWAPIHAVLVLQRDGTWKPVEVE